MAPSGGTGGMVSAGAMDEVLSAVGTDEVGEVVASEGGPRTLSRALLRPSSTAAWLSSIYRNYCKV